MFISIAPNSFLIDSDLNELFIKVDLSFILAKFWSVFSVFSLTVAKCAISDTNLLTKFSQSREVVPYFHPRKSTFIALRLDASGLLPHFYSTADIPISASK